MSEMVERVARAVWSKRRELAREWNLGKLPAWEDETEPLRDDVRAEAKIAIKAMREPITIKMMAEGGAAIRMHTKVTEVWQAMIDAALEDPK